MLWHKTSQNLSAENDPKIFSEVRSFLKGLNASGGKPIEQLTPADARRF
jgi:hypothetical protein